MYDLNLKVKKLENYVDGPTRKFGDAGFDLYAAEDMALEPGARALIKTGISTSFSPNFYMRIAPRSGMAWKQGINVLAGVIDSSYRGEIGVVLHNTTHCLHVFGNLHSRNGTVGIRKGDKIAQMIPEFIDAVGCVQFVENLEDSERGFGGFGSTGT